ncbi:MAG: hypothetical protein KBE65_03470 [Phycisphaerae bacterium]|nr:hypothetical protein [Phycisphaerae bacterium]
MTEGSPKTSRFFLLLGALRDGVITPRQFARLSRSLASSARLRQLYVEYMLLCAELDHQHGTSEVLESGRFSATTPGEALPVPVTGDAQAILSEVIEHDEQAAERIRRDATLRSEEIRRAAEAAFERFKEQERRRQEELAYRKYLARRRRLILTASVAATVVVSALWIWFSKRGLPDGWLHHPSTAASPAPSPTPQATPIVATIRRSVNAAWLQQELSTAPGTPLTTTPVFLTRGVLELGFLSGARIVLQAPAMLQPELTNQLLLSGGALSVRVFDPTTGFVVRTPTGTVVDYGTEFSVIVNTAGETEALVHEGKIGLRSGSDPIRALASQILTEGQASAVDAGGNVVSREFRPSQIIRRMPSAPSFGIPGERLDLADVVGGGNGFGTGDLGAAISPTTGQPVDLLLTDRTGTRQYIRVSWNPYIDGVFVPDGRVAQTIDSAGHVFAECPVTNNIYYMEITNVGQARCGWQRLSGSLYGSENNPCLLMHANLGITFDLAKIASSNPGLRIARFRSGLGVSEQTTDHPCNADFWVLVDGQVRFRLLGVRRKGLVQEVLVELSETDRFLTLVTTDGGDRDPQANGLRATDSDWAVFARPYLELTPKTPVVPSPVAQSQENTDRHDPISESKVVQ